MKLSDVVMPPVTDYVNVGDLVSHKRSPYKLNGKEIKGEVIALMVSHTPFGERVELHLKTLCKLYSWTVYWYLRDGIPEGFVIERQQKEEKK